MSKIINLKKELSLAMESKELGAFMLGVVAVLFVKYLLPYIA